MHKICVYCGLSEDIRPEYRAAAYQMGQVIARRGLQLWYGAGNTGMMGAVAQGVLDGGGQAVGVIPQIFNDPQYIHSGLTRLEVVEDMHQRKARLAGQADLFVALPGGYGTLEEFFEILTWAQIGLHSKPIGLLNTRRYFDPLLALVAHARAEGFIYNEPRPLFTWAETAEELVEGMVGRGADNQVIG